MKTTILNKARKSTAALMLLAAMALGAGPTMAHPTYRASDGRARAPLDSLCCDHLLAGPLVSIDDPAVMQNALTGLDILRQVLRAAVTFRLEARPGDSISLRAA